MVFRFTLDSATEFLFGQDVCSLSAGLPYPEDVPTATRSHPADIFAHSFGKAQELTAFRGRRGKNWALSEFFKDNVDEHRKVVEKFVDPIISEALRKRKELDLEGKKSGGKDEVGEDETLLDHLVNCTQGLSLDCTYLT